MGGESREEGCALFSVRGVEACPNTCPGDEHLDLRCVWRPANEHT